MRRLLPLLLSAWLGCGDDSASGGSGGAGSGASGPGGGAGTASGASGPGGAGQGGAGQGGAPPTPVDCAALPAPSGAIVNVDPSQAANLTSIVFDAAPGTTLVLAPGTYAVPGILQLRAAGVTLRSADDDAASVVLDGGYTVPEIFQITASDVTIAHVTITRAVDHLVHVFPPGDGSSVTGTRLYGLALVDGGEQFVKVNPVGDGGWLDDGRVECSSFLMTDAGRPHVESCCGGCYTGGVDAHEAQGWRVARNRFEGLYCDGAGLAEHAVHFWKGSRDTVVEDNVIVNCARAIGFGLGGGAGTRVYPDAPYGGEMLAHYDGVIRNNFVYADIDFFDTGIEIDEAKTPLVAHNTVIHDGGAGFFSSIDYRFASTVATIKNNLVDTITARDGATGDVTNNLEQTPLAYFVDPASGDLHLTDAATGALGMGAPLAEVTDDLDGDPRDAQAPDLGADER